MVETRRHFKKTAVICSFKSSRSYLPFAIFFILYNMCSRLDDYIIYFTPSYCTNCVRHLHKDLSNEI